MALSSILKTSIIRDQALKSLTSQILRSSSVCANTKQTQHLRMVLAPQGPKFPTPTLGSSQILAKYLSTSPVHQSTDAKVHDHVGIWKLERALSIALIPLIPAALISPNQIFDTLAAVIIVMHTHWGLEACVVDYIRPIIFGNLGPKIGMGLLYLFSAVTLAGCLNLIFNDIGLANTFRELWKL